MEGAVVQNQQQQQQQVERLNQALQQQLNLEAVKTRANSLFKAISRILEDFDAYGRTNTTPKWSFPRSSFLYLLLFLLIIPQLRDLCCLGFFLVQDLPAVWKIAQT